MGTSAPQKLDDERALKRRQEILALIDDTRRIREQGEGWKGICYPVAISVGLMAIGAAQGLAFAFAIA